MKNLTSKSQGSGLNFSEKTASPLCYALAPRTKKPRWLFILEPTSEVIRMSKSNSVKTLLDFSTRSNLYRYGD